MKWFHRATYICKVENQKYAELIEKTFEGFGIDPKETRCEGEGAWLLTRGHVGVYVDLWESDQPSQWQSFHEASAGPVFQVVCPVCTLPTEDMLKVFEEELLELNFHLFYGSFIINRQEKMVALIHKRLASGLQGNDIQNAVMSLSFYAEQLAPYFEEKYGVKRVEEE